MTKTKIHVLLLGLVLSAAAPLAVCADEISKDEQKLGSVSGDLDNDAVNPEKEKTVVDRLKAEFKVEDIRIQSLRDQKLGYGEIAIVLALAQKMPGGITDANVLAIMTLRQGPPVMGWGQIAKKQGLKLGAVVSKVKKIGTSARKQFTTETANRNKKERLEKSGRPDKPERPEKMERPEKPERPESPGNHGRH